ncbi:hypothetical protein ACFYZB_29215 [Streptomyces sp. NPDC001852]|uniref:hypothetical protein n=1 Tax=Streptomyces sp. NPDC001852 TaxID=3364619 RepID=UPI00368BA29A
MSSGGTRPRCRICGFAAMDADPADVAGAVVRLVDGAEPVPFANFKVPAWSLDEEQTEPRRRTAAEVSPGVS